MSLPQNNDSDDDFTFIDENDNSIEHDEEREEENIPKINKNGKHVRGKDTDWRQVKVYNTVDE